MRARLGTLLPGLLGLALVTLGCAGAVPPVAAGGLWERYLTGYQGPYRGRVVDAETKAPLAGAVVVAVWDREQVQLIQTNTVFYDAREVLTDAQGAFVLDAPEVERTAPRRTLRPYFVIFTPGYGAGKGTYAARGEVIQLQRLHSIEQRRNMTSLSRLGVGEVPRHKIRELIRLVNIESVKVGLTPYPVPDAREAER